uniref:Uncharacterized LOC100184019 n=2 Tax=Ciona intestinalis TaxID=7719 RepID=F6VJ82_CIOIN|nr:uncharacterized protein LOC100184019 isoform X1 [Ciona intestinalis]|eukprot:XP_002128940.1 uncharacterized protein LOC100184019 isoform X1 [Ciona intestinalis]
MVSLFGIEVSNNLVYVVLFVVFVFTLVSSQNVWDKVLQVLFITIGMLMLCFPSCCHTIVQHSDTDPTQVHTYLVMASGATLLCYATPLLLVGCTNTHVKNSLSFSRVLGFGTTGMVFVHAAVMDQFKNPGFPIMACLIGVLLFGEVLHMSKFTEQAYVPGRTKVACLMICASLGFLFGAFLFAFPDLYLSFSISSEVDDALLFYTRLFGSLSGGISISCACAVYFNGNDQNSVIAATIITQAAYVLLAIYHHTQFSVFQTTGHIVDTTVHAFMLVNLVFGYMGDGSQKQE